LRTRLRSEKPVAFAGRTREGSSLGITLTELVIIVGIVAMLAGLGIPAYNKYRDNANVVQAVSDIRTIEHDIYIYEGYNAKLPDFLDDIGKGYLRDPWGNPYQYRNATTKKGTAQQRFDKFSKQLNADFDLYSMGRDGNTQPNLDRPESLDDIVRADNGRFVGLASQF
jgi:general secretion pathway protein G